MELEIDEARIDKLLIKERTREKAVARKVGIGSKSKARNSSISRQLTLLRKKLDKKSDDEAASQTMIGQIVETKKEEVDKAELARQID